VLDDVERRIAGGGTESSILKAEGGIFFLSLQLLTALVPCFSC